VQAVLNGRIDPFIDAYIRMQMGQTQNEQS
jgi:hypothetical protein